MPIILNLFLTWYVQMSKMVPAIDHLRTAWRRSLEKTVQKRQLKRRGS